MHGVHASRTGEISKGVLGLLSGVSLCVLKMSVEFVAKLRRTNSDIDPARACAAAGLACRENDADAPCVHAAEAARSASDATLPSILPYSAVCVLRGGCQEPLVRK